MTSVPTPPPEYPSALPLRDLWLSEMWRPCPEVPREERTAQRARQAAERGR